jgi:tellurite resistance-related uncharacterized protein
MVGFHVDDEGDWVAELSCLHQQHIRHQPPFWEAAWILDDAERAARVGQHLDCPLCDRGELPSDLSVARSTAAWTEATLPAALQRSHRIAPRTWGVLRVEHGALRYVVESEPTITVELHAGDERAIPPEVSHHVEVLGPVRFHIDFLIPGADTPETTKETNT